MDKQTIIRRATKDDIDFIIETIIEAEKSGTDKISFCNIFSLSIDEVWEILKKILEKDVRGQELCISDYLICMINEEYAGACASWIEAIDGVSAAVLKGDLLFDAIPRENLISAKKVFPLIQGLNIEREPLTLQIANAYVKSNFRGMGVIGRLITEHVNQTKKKNPVIKKVQLRPTKTNDNACKAYEKIGFVKVLEKHVNNEDILKILPADTKILMEMYL